MSNEPLQNSWFAETIPLNLSCYFAKITGVLIIITPPVWWLLGIWVGGVLPLEMFNENTDLKKKIKIMELYDFTPKFEYYVDLVWSRESDLGAAARFLIEHIRTQRQLNNK